MGSLKAMCSPRKLLSVYRQATFDACVKSIFHSDLKGEVNRLPAIIDNYNKILESDWLSPAVI